MLTIATIDVLGSAAFTPVQKDMNGNIKVPYIPSFINSLLPSRPVQLLVDPYPTPHFPPRLKRNRKHN